MNKRKKNQPSAGNQGIIADTVNAQAIAVGKHAQATANYEAGTQRMDEVTKIFEKLTAQINEMPEGPEKIVAQSAVNGLKGEAGKDADAGEEAIKKWLNFLTQSAPDIWEVAITTFINPIQGLGLAFQKVAQRARAEKSAGK
jgi:hypothetical protein